MEPSLYRYILRHSRNGQLLLIALTVCTLPVVYLTLELPKLIVNQAIQGEQVPEQLFGRPLDQIDYLLLLCFAFLLAVLLQGGIKYAINVYRGVLGERLLRRLRYELCDRLLRFPLPHFRRVPAGEIVPMVTAETEPLGEFIGESFSLPALQGGLLFTYLLFIFNQDPLLGAAAVALYPFQLWLIPRLQRSVNQLAKQRVRELRGLSGRVGEAVAGAVDIRANATGRYERAALAHRLGRIFEIRYRIYRRKFFIKFINNFIAQLTPFFFYSVGGYLVIVGEMSLGALVAVLAAYKDLAGPWKELLRYYQRKEDVRVKYQQVIEQFQPAGLVGAAPAVESPRPPLEAGNLGWSDDDGQRRVEAVNLRIAAGEHLALLGGESSGAAELAQLLARLLEPDSGRLRFAGGAGAGDVGYVGAGAWLFSGSVRDNLVYALQRRPGDPPERAAAAEREHRERRRQAQQAGNSSDDIEADWLDLRGAGLDSLQALIERSLAALRAVGIEDDIYRWGLQSRLPEDCDGELLQRLLRARRLLRDRFADPDAARLVEFFDRERYNSNLSVAENLMFGTPRDAGFDAARLADSDWVQRVLEDRGLYDDFLRVGRRLAALMLELFADVAPDSELFERFSFIRGDDLPAFRELLERIGGGADEAAPLPPTLAADDRRRLLSLPFKLVVARHRLGLIDAGLQARLVAARGCFATAAADNGVAIDEFDADSYNRGMSVQENLVFGRIAYGQAHAQARIESLLHDVVDELGLTPDVLRNGLEYQVGVAGGRLSPGQRQRLALARVLLRAPALLVVDGATDLLDAAAEARLVAAVRELLADSAIVWRLGRAAQAQAFPRLLIMQRGRLVASGGWDELSRGRGPLTELLQDAGPAAGGLTD